MSQHLLTFDTETTGLPPKGKTLENDTLDLFPHIVQFSWINYDPITNEVLNIKDFIIKLPQNVKMGDECIKIHGITNEMSQEQGVDIINAIDAFIQDFYSSSMIIAHNLEFDLKLVRCEIMRILKSENLSANKNEIYKKFINDLLISTSLFCTMQHSIDICNIKAMDRYKREYIKFPKLSELHENLFQITPKNLHNSLNDVIICLRCFYKLRYDRDILEMNEELNYLCSNLVN